MTAHGDDEVDGSEELLREGGSGSEPESVGAAPDLSPAPGKSAAVIAADPATRDDANRAADPARDAEDPDPLGEGEGEGDGAAGEPRTGMTPRQARRVRAVVSGVVMAVVAVALVLRLGSAPSLLTVGGYGLALILSGTAIVLSRRGRTRVATAVLACGFLTIILAERALAGA
ncbi:hypothetical protein N566_07870 [Streptomycetaceae bacterium MP113-05]|nr:hypothetical protein N566_07870 [Streptomycetaceae bacterium MP113-05]